MKRRKWFEMAVIVGVALTLATLTQGYANPMPATSAEAVARTNVIAPVRVSLPPVPAKVLQMSEAGMNDRIMISYLQKSANSYTLNAEQIIYLHDLGVSSAVLEALVNHERTIPSKPSGAESSGAADMQGVSSASASAQSAPPVSGAAANFYEALAPYGTWVNVPTYGWCWQPTVEVVNADWQPYCNNGCWLWTDQGWYWNSYYSWGWAPFHYGRWCRYQGYGWLWRPDNVWGPAWVCWRDYPGYCGWAPLPPGAFFTAGVGWTFNGLSVGFNYGFGLGPRYFTFCDYEDFCSRHPFEHFRRDRDAEHFFNHSRVDNRWTLGAHHHFFDHGISLSRIEGATHTHIRQVAVRESPHKTEHSRHFIMPDRLTRNGNSQVIYRPRRDMAAIRDHFRHDTPSTYHWSRQRTVRGFTSEHTFGHTRFQAGRSNSRRPLARSGLALSHPTINRLHDQHQAKVENPRMNHFSPARNYHYNFSKVRRFTPAWHSAPAWHPTVRIRHPKTPAFHSAPVFHQRPTFHAVHTFHPAPRFHSARAFHPAPAIHRAPAFSHPTRSFGSVHFGGRSGHFGSVRHR